MGKHGLSGSFSIFGPCIVTLVQFTAFALRHRVTVERPSPSKAGLTLGEVGSAFVSSASISGRFYLTRHLPLFPIAVFVLLASSSLVAQKSLTATQAKDHIGEQGTVCGKVVSTRYAESSHGKPTFLNFDQPYPNQVFTMLIWGSDRAKFDEPETKYRGKQICVTGKIGDYKGTPEIVASEPSQVKAQ